MLLHMSVLLMHESMKRIKLAVEQETCSSSKIEGEVPEMTLLAQGVPYHPLAPEHSHKMLPSGLERYLLPAIGGAWTDSMQSRGSLYNMLSSHIRELAVHCR